jgi:hypothetical protein
VAQLRPKVSDIRARGAELCVIGNGTPKQAKYFAEHEAIDFPVRTDPTLEVYKRAGFRRGLFSTLHPRAAIAAIRAMAAGHAMNVTVKGDAFQQGGVVIVLPDGREAWRHINRFAGDHAAPEVVLIKLESALAIG